MNKYESCENLRQAFIHILISTYEMCSRQRNVLKD